MTSIEPITAGTPAYRDPPPFRMTAQGHDLGFYPAGKDRLKALMALIGGARDTLRICFYIFAEDDVSMQVRDALVAAARRGVRVTLILDGFGATASEQFLEPLSAASGRVVRFVAHWSQRYLIRNHQKIVVADESVAMIGGFNIEDDYFSPPAANGWNDLAITVRGAAVADLVRWYDLLLGWTGDARALVGHPAHRARLGRGQGAGAAAGGRADQGALQLGALRVAGPDRGRPAGHDDGLFLAAQAAAAADLQDRRKGRDAAGHRRQVGQLSLIHI